MEYLRADAHQLVPYSMTGVQQSYLFYHSRMRWADPDLDEAARRLQLVYSNRDAAREKAQGAAASLRERYAPEVIGELARTRLLDLLKRRDQPRWQQHRAADSTKGFAPPPQPIRAIWYDADYFEHGVKSNWRDGYTWSAFNGLFRDTASWVTSLFPEAESFLDAGCAKKASW